MNTVIKEAYKTLRVKKYENKKSAVMTIEIEKPTKKISSKLIEL